MKLHKSFVLYFAVALLSIFVTLITLKVYFELGEKKITTADLKYSLSPTKTDLKVGDKVSVPLYLSGKDSAKASAYDVKLYFDTTKFKITKATPGSFFDKYITIKWDQENLWFALAQTPSNPRVSAMTNLPVLTLELTAIAASKSTPLSTGTSLVYLTQTGGFHPEMSTVNFTIK